MRWSQEEIDIIRLHAPKTPLVELWSLFFQNRTKSSLQNKGLLTTHVGYVPTWRKTVITSFV